MQYCCLNDQRDGTCYFEFQKGKSEDKFWHDDSVYLHADRFEDLELFQVFRKEVPEFDYFGVTLIDAAQWQGIMLSADQMNESAKSALYEIDQWAQENIKTEKVFSVLGI